MTYRPRPRRQSARWLTLKYAAKCKVCGTALTAGERGYYDPAARTVTCLEMACCETDGLTREEWNGSPVSGRWIKVRAERRLGAGYVRDPGEDLADRWNETHQ